MDKHMNKVQKSTDQLIKKVAFELSFFSYLFLAESADFFSSFEIGLMLLFFSKKSMCDYKLCFGPPLLALLSFFIVVLLAPKNGLKKY